MSKFDKLAKEWDEKGKKNRINLVVSEYMKKNLDGEFDRSLEYGCGTAELSVLTKDLSNKITLVDSSSGMLEEAKKKISKLDEKDKFIVEKRENLEGVVKEYNLIYSAMTLHHIENTEKFLKEIYSSLKPGGRFMLFDLAKEDGSFHVDNEGVYHLGFDLEELGELLKRIGFKVLEEKIVMKLEKNNKNYEILVLNTVKN